MIAFGLGLGLVLAFTAGRLRYAWWPIHPILFAVLGTYQSNTLSMSFLVGWLIKTLVSRFFGTMAGGLGDDLYTQEVLSVVHYAQKLAVSSGCRVQIDFTSTSYVVNHETGCSGGSYYDTVRDGLQDP